MSLIFTDYCPPFNKVFIYLGMYKASKGEVVKMMGSKSKWGSDFFALPNMCQFCTHDIKKTRHPFVNESRPFFDPLFLLFFKNLILPAMEALSEFRAILHIPLDEYLL